MYYLMIMKRTRLQVRGVLRLTMPFELFCTRFSWQNSLNVIYKCILVYIIIIHTVISGALLSLLSASLLNHSIYLTCHKVFKNCKKILKKMFWLLFYLLFLFLTNYTKKNLWNIAADYNNKQQSSHFCLVNGPKTKHLSNIILYSNFQLAIGFRRFRSSNKYRNGKWVRIVALFFSFAHFSLRKTRLSKET